jgi:hypothetical protein
VSGEAEEVSATHFGGIAAEVAATRCGTTAVEAAGPLIPEEVVADPRVHLRPRAGTDPERGQTDPERGQEAVKKLTNVHIQLLLRIPLPYTV